MRRRPGCRPEVVEATSKRYLEAYRQPDRRRAQACRQRGGTVMREIAQALLEERDAPGVVALVAVVDRADGVEVGSAAAVTAGAADIFVGQRRELGAVGSVVALGESG